MYYLISIGALFIALACGFFAAKWFERCLHKEELS